MVCYHQNIQRDIGLMAFGPTNTSIASRPCGFYPLSQCYNGCIEGTIAQTRCMKMDVHWTPRTTGKTEACKERENPVRHAKSSSCIPSNEVPPSPGTIDHTSHVPEPRVGITNI